MLYYGGDQVAIALLLSSEETYRLLVPIGVALPDKLSEWEKMSCDLPIVELTATLSEDDVPGVIGGREIFDRFKKRYSSLLAKPFAFSIGTELGTPVPLIIYNRSKRKTRHIGFVYLWCIDRNRYFVTINPKNYKLSREPKSLNPDFESPGMIPLLSELSSLPFVSKVLTGWLPKDQMPSWRPEWVAVEEALTALVDLWKDVELDRSHEGDRLFGRMLEEHSNRRPA
ncbi:MAG: hypothetical protein J5J00_09220 [Deltaproteobacteria bacterium]|nr:hypothetical protein [Deltaproteobacteria bacterium]